MYTQVTNNKAILILVVVPFFVICVDVFTEFVGPSNKILLVTSDQESGIINNVRSYSDVAMLYVFH